MILSHNFLLHQVKYTEKKGRHGIEPNTELNPFFKIVLDVFLYAWNWFFSYILSLSNLVNCIVGYNRNTTNFKKVGSIPWGFNTMGTKFKCWKIFLFPLGLKFVHFSASTFMVSYLPLFSAVEQKMHFFIAILDEFSELNQHQSNIFNLKFAFFLCN